MWSKNVVHNPFSKDLVDLNIKAERKMA